MSQRGTYSSYISGPRWVDMEGLMLLAAKHHGIELTIDNVHKGLLRKSIVFTVSGDNQAIDKWCDSLIGWFK